MFGMGRKTKLPDQNEALPGRMTPIHPGDSHYVNGHTLVGPFPDQCEFALFGMGVFLGERKDAFGSCLGSTQRRWVMQRVLHPTQPMKRSVPA